MNFLRTILISVFHLFILQSCYIAHRRTVLELTQCYRVDQEEGATKIRSDGYYEVDIFSNDEERSFYRTQILFFSDDGIYVQIDSRAYFDAIIERRRWDDKTIRTGKFSIRGNEIFVEFISIGSGTSQCLAKKFTIIDANTLAVDNYQLCTNKEASNKPSSIAFSAVRFIPSKDIPSYDQLWIMKKKWFWCNKEEFKTWRSNNQ